MKKQFLLFFLLIGFFDSFSYPITPQTLRKEIENSKYIVIATINNPDPPAQKTKCYDKESQDSIECYIQALGGDGIANLKILKVLKGKVKSDSIIVTYPSYLSNPRPPRYPHEKKVIAFLKDNDSTNNYVTVGLSYGTILFELEESTALYEELIINYLAISKIRNKIKKKDLTASWLVKCCKERDTRRHGAYELSRSRHWMSYYDHSKDPQFAKYLTIEEINFLEDIVLKSDTISYNELCLSDFVTPVKHEELKKILIFNLKFFRIFFSADIMKRYLELEDNPELRLIYEEYKELSLAAPNNENKAKLLNDSFIRIAERN